MSAADEWLLEDSQAELLYCPEKVAEYEVSPATRLQSAGSVAPPQPPALCRFPADDGGKALVRGGTGGRMGAVPLAPGGSWRLTFDPQKVNKLILI